MYKGNQYSTSHTVSSPDTILRPEYTQRSVTKTEGTYLVWMDFRALGLSDKELKELIEDKAEVWLDGGAIFGEPGSGFERINVACQRATLVEALDRIEKAVKNK